MERFRELCTSLDWMKNCTAMNLRNVKEANGSLYVILTEELHHLGLRKGDQVRVQSYPNKIIIFPEI